ncbi:hypothetical protein [Roseiflexus sp.]|uniref:hypothetical protein n=1 Tax=Roseiflexus sp. TaxID=2562120 RepID=UPI00398AE629
MPKVRKLTKEEAFLLENKGKGVRTLIAAEYDRFLEDYKAGDYGEVELEPDDKRNTVRNRLSAAAKRRGFDVLFFRTRGSVIPFKIVELRPATDDATAAEASNSTESQPPRRRPGRPRKQPA